MDKITLKDRIRGSLIGGAIGDALGYPVEFMSRQSILKKFGNSGIKSFNISEPNGCAVISDDTQMTLFTATGLLFGITTTRWFKHEKQRFLSSYVREAYKEWYQTQMGGIGCKRSRLCWIRDIAELNVCRAPGNTCMSALADPDSTNNSKGCGGIMRVAPVAMFIASEISRGQEIWAVRDVQILAAECAAITHKHPMGYICAAVFADILFQILMCNDSISVGLLKDFIEDALLRSSEIFTKDKERNECENLKKQIDNAISLSLYGVPSSEAIRELGEGWTGDEALAISLFCTLRCLNNFHAALICAVNHDGDSDSTGAICGNLMGAIVGKEVFSFPDLHKLELKNLLLAIADDIAKGCSIDVYNSSLSEEDKQWEQRYIFGEDYITPFESVFMGRKPYKMLINGSGEKLPQIFQNAQTQQQKCSLVYDFALEIFDTEKFCPNEQLIGVNYNEEPNFYKLCKNLLPAYYWGFTDAIYSPRNNKRVFKLNVNCFKEKKNPIIAVRDDCGCHKKAMNEMFAYQLCAGLETFSDAVLQEKYPDWLFLKINFSTADADGFAVFANQLEKDFLVEVAHLGDDGKLHRVYILNY